MEHAAKQTFAQFQHRQLREHHEKDSTGVGSCTWLVLEISLLFPSLLFCWAAIPLGRSISPVMMFLGFLFSFAFWRHLLSYGVFGSCLDLAGMDIMACVLGTRRGTGQTGLNNCIGCVHFRVKGFLQSCRTFFIGLCILLGFPILFLACDFLACGFGL